SVAGPANGAPQGGILEANRAQSAGCGHANASIPENRVRVTVGNASREFDYKDIDSIWQIPLKMHEVFSFVRDNLVTQSDQREIEYAAINGMLSTLDPHSWLLKPDVYKEMKVQTRGEFGGLGFVISMIEDKLTVRKVLKNTPAYKGGVKKGDVITQIDNDSTVSMELQEAVDRMRGKPGTKVSIWVAHKGAEPRRLDLTRALVTYETVISKLLDNGIGYVRLSGFSGTTTRDMMGAIRSMKQQNGGSLRGLVLDMRGNPGGLLEQAIQVSDAFVEEGTIVTTVGVNGTLREPKLARADGAEREFPMAVLISSESASASEIVAGALKNLNRAVIVGRQGFGKGSGQVLYGFKDRAPGDAAVREGRDRQGTEEPRAGRGRTGAGGRRRRPVRRGRRRGRLPDRVLPRHAAAGQRDRPAAAAAAGEAVRRAATRRGAGEGAQDPRGDGAELVAPGAEYAQGTGAGPGGDPHAAHAGRRHHGSGGHCA